MCKANKENVFRHGGPAQDQHCPWDSGRRLTVEEDLTATCARRFPSTLPKKKNSCSLQNLSSWGAVAGVCDKEITASNMATLTPGHSGGAKGTNNGDKDDRSRSMEFLLDDNASKNAHLRVREFSTIICISVDS